jgi:GNAT superfamily N-acetyltransferase
VTHQGAVPSLEFWPLTKNASKASFGCGEKQVDDYFRKHAWKSHERTTHRVTCCALPGVSKAAAGFYSLACVTEEIGKLPGHYYAAFGSSKLFPCLQLAWMGVHKPMQGSKIGLKMLGRVVETFAKVGTEIGLPHLIVVPINDEVNRFYSKMDFEEYDKGERMFLPLQVARDAIGM